MPHLGDLTAAQREANGDPITFDFYGETFTVADSLSQMALMEFGKLVTVEDADANSLAGLAGLYDVYEALLVEQDWSRFKQITKKNRVTGDELNNLLRAVTEAMTGRPTSRPSDSSAGPPSTSQSSKDDFSSPEARREHLGLVPVSDLVSSAG